MLEHQTLDSILRALVDPTRRALVECLSRSPAAVGELAAPFDMSLAAVVQHLQALEAAGIIASEKIGRVRTCRLEPGGMDALALWIEARRSPAERRLDRLAAYLAEPESPADTSNTEEDQA
jgi:DNA-binding transcriptional ArsR family regulator